MRSQAPSSDPAPSVVSVIPSPHQERRGSTEGVGKPCGSAEQAVCPPGWISFPSSPLREAPWDGPPGHDPDDDGGEEGEDERQERQHAREGHPEHRGGGGSMGARGRGAAAEQTEAHR